MVTLNKRLYYSVIKCWFLNDFKDSWCMLFWLKKPPGTPEFETACYEWNRILQIAAL